MNKRAAWSICIFALFIGLFIGHNWNPILSTKQKSDINAQKKPLYWIDSMEPQIHYPAPGKSRMGMELVPVYPDETTAGEEATIQISPVISNNLGIRTTPVTKKTLARQVDTVGFVEPNEKNINHLHTYADGWIKKLAVKTIGEPVKKGQLLLQLYSPMLVTAQQEYLIALENKSPNLIDASYKRLLALRVSENQIQDLKSTRKAEQLVDVYAPQDGVITTLNIREGAYVTPEMEMMSLVDLSTIWMIAQVFEEQANWIKEGEEARASLSAFPGKVWHGKVDYIYPELDPTTRTLKVRFRFDNPEGVLKPNMYATVTILVSPKQNVMAIPLEALIRTSQGGRVIVALDKGRFQVRPVSIGMESGDQIEILSGLKPGEKVVTSGQFLIDSEVNLKTGLQRLEMPSEHDAETPLSGGNSTTHPQGIGKIKAINLSNQTITIQHEEIPALNWPSMTMDFKVEKAVKLENLKIEDQVNFNLKKIDDHWIITEIKKTPLEEK